MEKTLHRLAIEGLFLLGCSACVQISRLDATIASLPAELEWVAMVSADRERPGSGFVRRDQGRFEVSLLDFERAEPVWVVGYRADTFARLSPPDETALRRAHARIAWPTEPRLSPAADWAATGQWTEGGDGLELTEIAERPDIYVDWLPRCPVIVPPEGARLATTCLVQPCATRVTQQGCRLASVIEGCGISVIGASVGPRGELLLDESVSFGACTPAPAPLTPTALASAQCATMTQAMACEVHLVRDAPPAFTVQKVKVYDVPVVDPPDTDLHRGYLGGAVVRDLPEGPRLIVAGHSGRLASDPCHTLPSELAVYDPDSLIRTATVGGFTCLLHLAEDPATPSALFAAGDDQGRRVLRVDLANGDRTSSPLAAVPDPERTRARSLHVSRDGARVVVAYSPNDNLTSSRVHIYRRDLTPAFAPFDVLSDAVDAVLTPEGMVRVTRDNGDVADYDPATGLLLPPGHTLFDECGQGSTVTGVSWDFARSNTGFMSGRHGRNGRAIFTVSLDIRRCRFGTFYEWPGSPGGAIDWPLDPSLLLVGVDAVSTSDPATWRSALALFEKDGVIYRPGAVDIGDQVILPSAADRRGRVFVYLPFDAIIGRVDPLP